MAIAQWIHFGVDNVIGCFQWIYDNQPQSIFEEPMLAGLKKWHLQYGLSCGMYLCEQNDDFNIAQLQDVYWEQLTEESDWLKVSWQGKNLEDRTSGEINAEMESLQRVYRLIALKTKGKLWGAYAKIPVGQMANQLLSALRECGIRVFLIQNAEDVDYLWEKWDKAIFLKEHCIKSDEIEFWMRDLCLDSLADQGKAEQLVSSAALSLREYSTKGFLDTFFDEINFKDIEAGLDKLLSIMGKISIRLLPDAACLTDGNLYFTAGNSIGLYVADIRSAKTKRILDLPEYSKDIPRLLVCYHSDIWIVPKTGEKVTVVDTLKKRSSFFLIASLCDAQTFEIDRYYVEDRYLWLVFGRGNCAVKIDMETKSLTIFSESQFYLHNSYMPFSEREVFAECKRRIGQFAGEGSNLHIDTDAEEKNMEFMADLEEVHKWYVADDNKKHSAKYTLEDYIRDVCNDSVRQWTEIKRDGKYRTAGEAIYCCINQ